MIYKTMKFKILVIIWSSIFCVVIHNSCVSSGGNDFIRDLKRTEKSIPLPYHEALEDKVKQLSGKPLPETFKLYESFTDSLLLAQGMPSELKYLPFALSGMRPDFVDDDCCGYWALPSLVAIRYGLTVDECRDERLDVKSSTMAALDYLDDLHQKYDDWWQSILAFANSPIALNHALLRSDAELEPWDFYEQQALPNTKCVADFIACVYLGSHNKLDFSQKVVEPSIIKTPPPLPEETKTEVTAPSKSEVAAAKESPKTQTYIVKKGDTLTKIAAKYHVAVSDLMEWNHLKNDKIIEGQKLTIKK